MWALVATGLGVASYTTTGYQYQVWPQFFLQYALRYSGRLKGDWATSFAPTHWAVAHVLAWVPPSLLAGVVFVLWLLSLATVWLGFAAVCRTLRMSWFGVVGAGLVAVVTGFTGLGLTAPLTGLFYPTELSFGLAIVALAAVMYGRPVLVGLALGFAILLHPDMGVLGALVVLPAQLVVAPVRPLRRHLPLGLALLIPAAPAIYEGLTTLALSSSLSAHQRYELLVLRAPWHFLYRAFPATQWVMVGAWLLVFLVALPLLPRDPRRRALAAVAAAVIVVCALGGIASQVGRPLFLVQLQTARLSSFLVLLGIVAAFAALHGLVGRWAGAIGVLVFLLEPAFRSAILDIHRLPTRLANVVSTSGVEAGTVLVVLACFAWWLRATPAVAQRARVEGVVFAILLLAAALTLAPDFQNARDIRPSQAQQDWIAVAKDARAVSAPRDVFLVPPDQDLFSLWAYRPVVVTFGSFEFGNGDSQWVRRISIVTGGDPRALDPAYTTDLNTRIDLIESDYDHTIATSRKPICAFGARFVVVESSVTPPTWLEQVDTTPTWDLYKVKPKTCVRA